MVLDTIANAERYAVMHPLFGRAFEHLKAAALGLLAAGRHPIDGDRLYLSVDHVEGRRRDGARLEVHRRYIDIQLTISGSEEIGWAPLAHCRAPSGSFDESGDIGFFDDRPVTWFPVPPGSFAIFFPTDAHAPRAGSGHVRKAIAKVRL